MKRIFTCVAFLLVLSFGLVACSDVKSTEYDDKEVQRIETRFTPGESTMNYNPTRTFDFAQGTVSDERVLFGSIEFMLERYAENPEYFSEYATAEEYEEHLLSYYNSPEQISNFTAEEATALMEEIISYGFYNWKEYYDEDDVTCGGSWWVKVTFTDGTVKQSGFYFKHPREHKALENFDKIEAAFINSFGLEMFMTF